MTAFLPTAKAGGFPDQAIRAAADLAGRADLTSASTLRWRFHRWAAGVGAASAPSPFDGGKPSKCIAALPSVCQVAPRAP